MEFSIQILTKMGLNLKIPDFLYFRMIPKPTQNARNGEKKTHPFSSRRGAAAPPPPPPHPNWKPGQPPPPPGVKHGGRLGIF